MKPLESFDDALEICKTCDKYEQNNQINRCLVCNCTIGAFGECPLGKWEANLLIINNKAAKNLVKYTVRHSSNDK